MATSKDGRVGSRIEAYTKFWQQDPNTEKEADTKNRLDSYTDVINGEPSKNALAFYLLQLLNTIIFLRLLRWCDGAV